MKNSKAFDTTQISSAPDIVTRAEAIVRGLPRYFTGKPCAHGHLDFRTTGDRKCDACNRERVKQWRKDHPDKLREVNRTQYETRKEQRKDTQRKWNAANAAYAAEYARAYRKANPEVAREWRQNNKQRAVWYATTRRAAKLQRTPKWADGAAIEAFYLACPPGHHVDHVIPLRGKLVSGLHVVNNLQYLTDKANMSKGNKFDPETLNEPA